MAISNADIAAIPTYTSAEQLKMWQKASIDVAATGFAYGINGRTLTKSNANEIKAMLEFWEERVAVEDPSSCGGIALVQIGERV